MHALACLAMRQAMLRNDEIQRYGAEDGYSIWRNWAFMSKGRKPALTD